MKSQRLRIETASQQVYALGLVQLRALTSESSGVTSCACQPFSLRTAVKDTCCPSRRFLNRLRHDRPVVDKKIASNIVASDEAEGFFRIEEFDRAGRFITAHI